MVVIFGLFKLFSGSAFGIYKLRLRKVRGVWSSKLGSYISHCFFATDKVLEKVVIWGVAFSTHSHRNSTVSARISPLFCLPNFKELVPLSPPIFYYRVLLSILCKRNQSNRSSEQACPA